MTKPLNPTKTTKEVWVQDGKEYPSSKKAADAWLAKQLLAGTTLSAPASQQTLLWQLEEIFNRLDADLPTIFQQYLDTTIK